MTNVLIILTHAQPVRQRYYDAIKARFPSITLNVVDHHSKAGSYLASADALVTFGTMTYDRLIDDAPRLRWIQALGTGVDGIVDLPSFRPDIAVTNIRGIHGAPMSEAALMAMLAFSRDLPRSVRAQDRHSWERWQSRLLDQATVGIFGIGTIAEALAPRCKALGMTVVGISSVKRMVAGFDRIFTRDELLDAVRGLDFLVILTPYSAKTKNAVNETVFAAMKPTAYVINLARGGVVDESALLKALDQKQIAGAALDVFATEPLPADHPLWSRKDIILTSHLGGLYDRYADDAMPTIEHNLRCFLAGDMNEMINIVGH
ncbi:MAG: D-2-hydroxyacid dehydrogenase [Rhizobiales bacterium]|nr:D-2-hydroxyacid dehydrogenase [Hyphomicrobiales bacterium]